MTAVDRMAEGYEPNHDIDRAVGSQAELFVANLIDSLGTAAVEVKHDAAAIKYGNAYFEFGCNYPRAGWRKTGIYATRATLWAHVLPGPVAVIFPVELLRGIVDHHRANGGQRELTRGSHPTVGVVVPLSRLLNDAMYGVGQQGNAA